MAFRASDIAARAAVPPQFQPSPDRAGSLTRGFAAAGLSDRDRHNLGLAAVDPDATAPSFMLTGAQANARSARQSRSEERKREDERRYVIQQIISQIAERNRQIAENLKRYADLERQEAALKDYVSSLRKGEAPALDAEGKLRNRDAETAIREYEDRYGVTVDRSDAAQIEQILGGIRDEKLRIVRENEDLAADNERDRKLALDMGANPESIPATVTALESTEAGQRSTNLVTANLPDSEQRKAVVERIFADSDRALGIDAITSPDDGFDEIVSGDGARQSAPGNRPPTPI